jgi:hypothetical protein
MVPRKSRAEIIDFLQAALRGKKYRGACGDCSTWGNESMDVLGAVRLDPDRSGLVLSDTPHPWKFPFTWSGVQDPPPLPL